MDGVIKGACAEVALQRSLPNVDEQEVQTALL